MRATRSAVASLVSVFTVGILAAQGPEITATPSDQFYAAIRGNDLRQLSALIDRGLDVNVKERRSGATPLMHAAAFGSLEAVNLLLGKGADARARSASGATALMWAATDLAKVRALIAAGADVNAASEAGRSALLVAAMSDQSAEIVTLLLQKGADPRVVDSTKLTTVTAAAMGNDLETLRQLVEAGVSVNASGGEGGVRGDTPLMSAIVQGNLEAVRLLLTKGANVNAVSGPPSAQVKNGIIALGQLTPLLLASANGPVEIVRALLDAGASVNVRDARGLTPLMLAVATDHGDLEIVKLLIARGADLQARDLQGETALDWALKNGDTRDVAALKQAGASASPIRTLDLPPPAPTTLRAAVERSVATLERASGEYFAKGGCGACHAQNITDVATMAARQRGVSINGAAATERARGAASAFAATATRLLERFDTAVVDIPLYTIIGLAAGNYPADRATDVLVANVAALQRREGHWHNGGVARPPIADGNFSRTALGIRALRTYAMPGRAAEMSARVQRAAAWLRAAQPVTTEDRSFRTLGLAWAGVERSVVAQAAGDLVATQRTDGGWGQRAEMGSDAYATGLAMYALIESGASGGAASALERGTSYLLSTQRADGTWYVRSRAPKFQPYFESGFPYGHDQWISSMATGWATAALAGRLSGPPASAAFQ